MNRNILQPLSSHLQRGLLRYWLAFASILFSTESLGQSPQQVDSSWVEKARINYILYCQGCHLPGGEGSASGTPDFKEYGQLLLNSPAGRAYYTRVPGAANAPLSDRELADVLNYISRVLMAADTVALFSEQEVTLNRRNKIANVELFKQELLQQLTQNAPTP